MTGNSFVAIGEMLAQFESRPGQAVRNIGHGGDSLAVAATIAHIAEQARLDIHTQYYTALGPIGDLPSDAANAFVCSQGVGSSLIQRLDGRTVGTFVVNYDSRNQIIPDPQTGERFTFTRKESAATQMVSSAIAPTVIESLSTDFDYVYLSSISLSVLCHRPGTRGAAGGDQEKLIELIAKARSNGKTTVLGTNLRSGLWGFKKGMELSHPQKQEALRVQNQTLRHTDIALASLADEQELVFFDGPTPQCDHAGRMHELGVKTVVITNGPGDILISRCEKSNRTQEWVKTFEVKKEEIGNEAGLGDAFAGGYILGDMIGKSPTQAALIGAMMGATALKTTKVIIDQDMLPNMGDILGVQTAAHAPAFKL